MLFHSRSDGNFHIQIAEDIGLFTIFFVIGRAELPGLDGAGSKLIVAGVTTGRKQGAIDPDHISSVVYRDSGGDGLTEISQGFRCNQATGTRNVGFKGLAGFARDKGGEDFRTIGNIGWQGGAGNASGKTGRFWNTGNGHLGKG